MRVLTRTEAGAVLLGLVAAIAMRVPASASAKPSGSSVVGHVNDNTTGVSTIGASIGTPMERLLPSLVPI
jgi:hypothetical protein